MCEVLDNTKSMEPKWDCVTSAYRKEGSASIHVLQVSVQGIQFSPLDTQP